MPKGAIWCMAFLMSKAMPAGTLMELGQAPHPAVWLGFANRRGGGEREA